MIVSVVAGGYSVRGDGWILEALPGYIIGVNDSALHLPRVDAVVSMDRLWTENRWDWLCEKRYPSWIRGAALKRILPVNYPWLNVFDCDYKSVELSSNPKILNGTNSGMCGFNLAYTMMPRVIALFGMDFCLGPNGEQHWTPPYPWKSGQSTKPPKLQQWSKQFKVIARQCRDAGIKVFNCSSRSLIEDFEKKTPAEILQ